MDSDLNSKIVDCFYYPSTLFFFYQVDFFTRWRSQEFQLLENFTTLQWRALHTQGVAWISIQRSPDLNFSPITVKHICTWTRNEIHLSWMEMWVTRRNCTKWGCNRCDVISYLPISLSKSKSFSALTPLFMITSRAGNLGSNAVKIEEGNTINK